MVRNIKTKDLSKVLVMTNTSDTNFIAERSGKIYRTPFRGEGTVSRIDKNDLIMFQDTVTDGVGSNKIVSINYGDFLMPIIDPVSYPIYTKQIEQDSEGFSVIPLERGSIDPEDGDWLDYKSTDPYVRSAVYIPIEMNKKYKFRCESGEIFSIRIMLCDREKQIIHDKWFNGISNYQNVMVNMIFESMVEEAHYMMFDVRGAGNANVKFEINTTIGLQSEHVVIKQFMFVDDYNFLTTDTLEAKDKQLEINHEGSRSKVTTMALQAPSYRPLDVKLRLINSGYKTHQYVDLRSVRDNEDKETRGRVEIGIRSFDGDTPMPQFCVGFAEGINNTLIHRFIVDPDAMLVHLTKDGVQFRTSNVSNNKPGLKELYTINFKSLNDKVNKCYTSLLKYNMIIDEVTPEGLELINISADHIDYDNDLYPNVQLALDRLLSYNAEIDTEDIHTQLNDLYDITSGIDINMQLLDLSTAKKISDLTTTVNTYEDRIQSAERLADGAKKAVDAIPDYYGDIRAVSNRVADIESYNVTHSAEFANLDNRVIALNNSHIGLADEMYSIFRDIDMRLFNLNAMIDNITNAVRRLGENDINLESTVNTNCRAITSIMNNLTQLNTEVTNFKESTQDKLTEAISAINDHTAELSGIADQINTLNDFVTTAGSPAIRDMQFTSNTELIGVEQNIANLTSIEFTTERDNAMLTASVVMNPYNSIMVLDPIEFNYTIRLDDKEITSYTSVFQMRSEVISFSIPMSVATKGEHNVSITGMLRSDGYIEFNPNTITITLDIYEPAVKPEQEI